MIYKIRKIKNITIWPLFSLSISVLTLISLASCENKRPSQNYPPSERGIIDLSRWDFDKQGIVPLRGQWEFHWQKLIYPEKKNISKDFHSNNFFHLPGLWNNSFQNENKLTGRGFGTYRLRVKLDRAYPILAIKSMEMKTAFELYVDDKLIIHNGKPGKNKETARPQYLPKISSFIMQKKEFLITLLVSNFHHKKGGVLSDIWLGKTRDIIKFRDRKRSFEIFLMGLFIIMGAYHFTLFFMRKKEKSLLYFGFFCLLIALRNSFTGEKLFFQIFSNFNWRVGLIIEYINIYALLPIFTLFIYYLFPEESKKPVVRITQVAFFVFALASMILPTVIVTKIFAIYLALILLAILYVTYVLFLTFLRKRELSLTFLSGWLFLFTTVTNDILHNTGFINTGYFAQIGLFIFMFFQFFILSYRFSRAYKSVETLAARLKQLDKLKNEFIANTSNELRLPLAGIINISDSLLNERSISLSEKIKQNLSLVLTSAKRLENLVKDLLDFSSMKRKEIILNYQKINLHDLTKLTFAIIRPLVKDKEVLLVNDVRKNLPLISADGDRLQQVFFNLIGNAIKFTEKGTVSVSARVIGFDNNLMEITINDTGPGIPWEEQGKIFDSFEQVSLTTALNYGGTGLGLSITRDLIKLHQGDISVHSIKGQGSDFIFTLPIKMKNESDGKSLPVYPIPSISNYPVEPYSVDRTNRINTETGSAIRDSILIVDDEPINIQVLENQLNLAGFEILTATGGKQALDIIFHNERTPDLVLLDIMMPFVSGFNVAKKIREKFSLYELPVILLSAKNQTGDIIEGLHSGANDFLIKPFNKQELMARINTNLTLKKAVLSQTELSLLQNELKIARGIQENSLPRKLPDMKGIQISAKYLSAAEVGGDLYAFHEIDPETLGILIADVSGQGIPAAIIASMIKIAFTLLVQDETESENILHGINHMLKSNIGNQFITANYITIDKKKMELSQARAGHPSCLVFRPQENRLLELNGKSRAIGISKEPLFSKGKIELKNGDRIILFTNGITDCRNLQGELFGFERFHEFIENHHPLGTEEFIAELIQTLTNWNAQKKKLEDDLSLVVFDIE